MSRSNASATRQFREHYQSDFLPRRYSGYTHLTTLYLAGGTGIALALWIASADWQPVHFWTVPATLLLANVVEYLAHRGPMHNRRRLLQALFIRHATRHHRYFRGAEMHFASSRDFHAVLFPPVLLLFFGGITALLGGIAALFLPAAAAALFVASALGYYLAYETLHFLYHVPPHWRAGRLPGVMWLARLHRLHHDPRLMQTHNFNLVFPLCDWIFRTLWTRNEPMPALSPVSRGVIEISEQLQRELSRRSQESVRDHLH